MATSYTHIAVISLKAISYIIEQREQPGPSLFYVTAQLFLVFLCYLTHCCIFIIIDSIIGIETTNIWKRDTRKRHLFKSTGCLLIMKQPKSSKFNTFILIFNRIEYGY